MKEKDIFLQPTILCNTKHRKDDHFQQNGLSEILYVKLYSRNDSNCTKATSRDLQLKEKIYHVDIFISCYCYGIYHSLQSAESSRWDFFR